MRLPHAAHNLCRVGRYDLIRNNRLRKFSQQACILTSSTGKLSRI